MTDLSKHEKKILCDFLRQNHNIESTEVLTLLDTIEAPDCVIELGTIVKNLIAILPFLHRISPSQFPTNLTDEWTVICSAIDKNKEKISRLITDFYLPGRKRPKVGHIISNPIYFALWVSPLEATSSASFHHLQAHLICSIIEIKKIEHLSKNEGFIDIRRNISNMIRNHLVKDLYIDFFKMLPPPTQDTVSMQVKVANVLASPLAEKTNIALRTFNRLLNFALHNSTEREIKQSFQDARCKSKNIFSVHENDPDTVVKNYPSVTVKFPGSSTRILKKGLDAGDSPQEFLHPSFAHWSLEPIKTKRGESHGLRLHKETIRHRYIATNNQQLPSQWNRLNLYDITHFMVLCSKLSKGVLYSPGLEIKPLIQMQLAALLTIIYWLSKPINEAKQSLLITDACRPKITSTHDISLQWPIRANWNVSMVKLSSARAMQEGEDIYLKKTNTMMTLPLCEAAYVCIAPYVFHLRVNTKIETYGKLFPKSKVNKFELLLKEILFKYNKQLNTRLTLHRIASHFQQYLSDEIEDQTEASICLGNLPTKGQQSAMYYASPTISDLQQKYEKASSKLSYFFCHNYSPLKRVYPKRGNDDVIYALGDDLSGPYIPSPTNVGSQTCLEIKTVSLLTEDLICRTEILRKRKGHDPTALMQFHNSYTAYCIMFLKFISGYRDVRDPLFTPTNFIEKHKLLIISDKNDQFNFKTRLVPIPDIFCKQIRAYNLHRLSMISALTLINPGLSKAMQEDIIHVPSFANTQTKTQIPFFIFLNDITGRMVHVRPTSLKKEVEWSYNLPLNANRHFLRTELRKLNISGEIINAYMGHWGHGQEPFGEFSTLDPTRYYKEILQGLDTLTKTCGWEVLKGIDKK